MNYACPYCPAVATRGNNLLRHLRDARLYGGHQIPPAKATLILERIGGGGSTAQASALPSRATRGRSRPAADAPFLQPGHWRSLELLENAPAVRETLGAYQSAIGHPVYLRPTHKGLLVMSLDPTAPSMVGPAGVSDCHINALPPAPGVIDAAIQAHQRKVASMKRRSVEERYVLSRVRKALANGLDLGDDLLLIHQQWRSSFGKIDILALDRQTGQLVVVEAESSEVSALDRSTAELAREHALHLTAHASECMPFFQRLASALARVYRTDGEAPSVDASRSPRSEIWWPEGRIRQSSPAPATP